LNVFAELDETPRAKTCDAIMGIIEEGELGRAKKHRKG
jgi:ferritin-like metal-binding protein YciE